MSPFAHITGWGMAVPERVLTNLDLEKIVDTNDDWIRSRTGIRERRIADAEETTASLATEAALHALVEGGKQLAPAAGAAGVAGGAGYGAYRMAKKSSADVEELAQQRAYQLAEEAGYIKEASAEEMIERRALEICEEAGLPVEWNE